jgi:hypothetical protein
MEERDVEEAEAWGESKGDCPALEGNDEAEVTVRLVTGRLVEEGEGIFPEEYWFADFEMKL